MDTSDTMPATAPPEQSRRAQSKLAALLNATPDAVILIDGNGIIESFNPGAERIFGYSAKEIVGQNVAMLMPLPVRSGHDGYIQRYQRTGEARFMLAPREVEACRKDGSLFPAEVSVGQVDGAELSSFIGIIRDISERVAAEARLHQVEANLLTAQSLAHVGSFEGDWPASGANFWSDEFFRIAGLSPDQAPMSQADFVARFAHPDDRPHVEARLAEDASKSSGGGELEYRIIRPDGTIRHIQTIYQIVANPITGKRRIEGTILDQTFRRHAEEALRRERDRAQRYLDLVNVMIIAVNRAGRITLVNRKACELFGTPEHELIGKDFFAACQPPGFAGRSRILFEEALAGRESSFSLLEGPVLTRDGHTRRVFWRNQFLRDDTGSINGVLSAGEDVTEQRETEAQLRQAEEELRLIFRRAPVGMATLSAAHEIDGHYLTVNQALCNMLGYTESELLARSVRDVTPPDDIPDTLRQFRTLFGGADTVKYEKRFIHKNGSIVHALVHLSVILDHEGRPMLIISQILDRTDVVLAEMEARKQRERLAHVARLGTLGEMAAGIAHELNQPLAAIANYTQACQRLLAAGQMEADELGEVLGRVTGQARRAGDVIHRLRAFVRRHTPDRRHRDANELIVEILPLVEMDCRSHEVDLKLQFQSDLPRVQVDGIQLQQVLLNLTRNAVEAMNACEPESRRLVIRTEALSEDEVELAVEDAGPGVPDSLLEQLFEPFFTTKPEGMGLGLSLSRSIIEAHGGILRYDSGAELGSVFRIRLPTAPEEE
ncbi:PAS domain S-box protein [Wenzhouxiangella sp. XN24]|uniref:PAS domain-containing sensor histidine kinase n=1 Tax=Wenzhouxiangella sp. XN24 TaxID=2713569 RepID=UPI0013EAF848|nr:PAS domain S-box protein [Wenzhouxiangella sp. XN24]NGX17581.1 PAS domain S-box protein [Wenzhouxiangella sp. XN24]